MKEFHESGYPLFSINDRISPIVVFVEKYGRHRDIEKKGFNESGFPMDIPPVSPLEFWEEI
ncbi:hypothetical protein ABID95_007940 [Streptomyces atratus]